MYQNKVTLIGFLGNDAEVRSNDNRSLTTLSLATKSSYKKDGKYIEHTEWHRCVVFGKLGEFASTLKKGAHIQVEGELRSRKYDSKKTKLERRPSGRFGSTRFSSWIAPPKRRQRSRKKTMLRRRKRPHKPFPIPSIGSSANAGLPSL